MVETNITRYPNVIHKDIYYTNFYLYYNDTNNNVYKKIGRYIGVREVEVDIDTHQAMVILEFYPIYGGELRTHKVNLSTLLSTSKLEDLNSIGADVTSLNKGYVLQHLRNALDNVIQSYIHTTLGFSEYDNKLVFKHYNLIGGTKSSKYDGVYSVKPKGTFKAWDRMYQSEVKGNIPLEAVVLFGLTAPTVAFLGEDVHVQSQLIHIVGDSSVGKTTALQLAISLFGAPTISKNSLIFNYNSTQNGLIKKLSGNMGIPMGIDEASMSSTKDWTEFLYIITGGEDKNRMTKDCLLAEQSPFRTVVLSSGEFSLISKAANNTGIRARVSEYSGITWTQDSENSNKIKSICLDNYGHLGPKFVEELMKLNKESLVKAHKSWCNKIKSKLNHAHIKDRLAQKLAIYMLTGHIANKKLNLQLDLEGILDFLITNENCRLSESDIAIKAYEYIMEIVSKNFHHFKKIVSRSRSNRNVNNTECWGFLITEISKKTNREEILEIGIAEHQLRDFLEKDNKFQSMDTIITAWLKKGWIIRGKDRICQRRTIGEEKTRVNCYVFDVPKINKELYGDEQK
ncbi:DUF927 domain-containing protein [Turicibacter sanguinis]|nr:DUF927 domain-containing protein [Turicibacter sanguinis]